MDSYTQFANEMHRYRADQFVASVEKRRLLACLPRMARSFDLGFSRLNFRKPAPQAQRAVCELPT